MTDLDSQLRALADHRVDQIPERSPTEDPEITEEAAVDWAGLGLRARRIATVAAILAILVLGVLVLSDVLRSTEAQTSTPGRTGPSMSDRDLITRDDWARPLTESGRPGTFVLARIGEGFETIQVAVPDRARQGFLPASTFKILNALIILETGTLPDVDTEVGWDGVTREFESWNRDHSLRTGMEVSAVWVFQELARRVGEEAMTELVAAADYGNTDTTGGVDRFWLEGALRTSAVDQLDFLERLALDQLPFDSVHQAAVRDILVVEQGPGWEIRYKTGTAFASEPAIGWLVGVLDTTDGQWVFAYNVDLPTVVGEVELESNRGRLDLVIELLKSAGVVDR